MKQKKFYARDKDIENTFLFSFLFYFLQTYYSKIVGRGDKSKQGLPLFIKEIKGFGSFNLMAVKRKWRKTMSKLNSKFFFPQNSVFHLCLFR